MLKLAKRKDSPYWWVTGTSPSGKRIRQSTQTADERQAAEFKSSLEVALWRQDRLGETPAMPWKDAVVRWVKEKQQDGRRVEDDLSHLRWLDARLADKTLNQIDQKMIAQLVQQKKADNCSNATCNRMLAVVRGILRKAEREWGTLEKCPGFRPLREPKGRIRWLTHDQARRLLQELPDHQAALVRFALATGLRQNNVLGLRWSAIDLSRRVAWVQPEDSKSGKGIPVPLNDDAVDVLRQQVGRHKEYVFTYKGEPIGQANTKAWKEALKRAGISNFRWHDLRHTWASWHVQNGTSLEKLQQLGGWNSFEMVLRYAHLAPEHLAGAASNIGTILTRSESGPTVKAA